MGQQRLFLDLVLREVSFHHFLIKPDFKEQHLIRDSYNGEKKRNVLGITNSINYYNVSKKTNLKM